MAENNEVALPDSSPHQVAWELTNRISSYENPTIKGRKYWLKLYAQCRSVVVDGIKAEKAMEDGVD